MVARAAPDEQPDSVSGGNLFTIAQKAAEERQPDRMIEALAACGFLDGLVRRLEKKWGRLPRIELEEVVAQAVDSAYDSISGGRQVRNLGAWLWKASDNRASDRWREDFAHRSADEVDLERLRGKQELRPEARAYQDQLADYRRQEAIRLARNLLPRIGQGQVVSVMELLIDAVERGIPDLPSTDIGAVLGISAEAARTLLGRGLGRLRREAEREGIILPEDLGASDQAEEDPEDESGDI